MRSIDLKPIFRNNRQLMRRVLALLDQKHIR
ncbi:hypothetical protein P3T37_000893 [Kitasatospora sp. MAA4]|nr:hypothetical protein [Kitasatospora sp. MAA4]